MLKTRILLAFVFVSLIACQPSVEKKVSVIKNQWPSFRGQQASGVMDNSAIPTKWNVEENINLDWKTPIPGLAHSSPIIWDDKIFVTSAISSNEMEELKVGLYGSGGSAQDTTIHQFRVYCLDKNSGEIIWDRLAHAGVPKTKRHTKATQANCTPATDGKYLVAFFASEGLFCYNLEGDLLWTKDLGKLQTGPRRDITLDWGFSSSPVIYKDRVVVQCDFSGDSFLATFDLETGKEIWRMPRDEFSTWGSPTVIEVNGSPQIIVNGFDHIGSYDFETGEEIWWMHGGGDNPVPTPIFSNGLIYINSGHGKMKPIYAIKPEAKGNITLAEDESSNEFIVWSIMKGGAYMTTNLVYGEYIYNIKNNGLMSCFNALTGELMYKEPLRPGGGISASAVASDGRVFFTSELGDVFVIKAGPEYELLAKNPLGEICMATPAIVDDGIYFRTQGHLLKISNK